MIGAALSLATFVPGIARWLGGDKAGSVAEKVMDVARTVAGLSNDSAAVAAIQNNPQLQIEFQKAVQPVLIAQYEAETRQLESINATMRAEYASSKSFVAYWRPMFGYIVAFTWLMMMAAMTYVMVVIPDKAAGIIESLSALSFMWSIALAVLGISVRERSKDKQVAAGLTPASLMGAVTDKLLK